LYRFLAITVLLDVKDIPQVGPLQWGWITGILSVILQPLPMLDFARSRVIISYSLLSTWRRSEESRLMGRLPMGAQ
jgi:hypothetical protein